MDALLAGIIRRPRTVLLILLLVLLTGASAYYHIAKERTPDINIPQLIVTVQYPGISPEDADQLLVKPLTEELSSISGLKEISSTAAEGSASVILEFFADVDIDQALSDVRQQTDIAKVELPEDAEEPRVREINLSLFPILLVTLAGDFDQQQLFTITQRLADKLETLPGVLEAAIRGDQEQVAEIIVAPHLLDSYNLSLADLLQTLTNNNRLIAAGTLDSGAGRFAVKVPGLLNTTADILNLPIKTVGDRVVTLADVAWVRRAFRDATTLARINGQSAVSLEITKRIGANIIATTDQVKAVVAAAQTDPQWPQALTVSFSQDISQHTRTSLRDLTNNVLLATFLVLVIIIASLGPRTALLVGISIPGSFLASILLLSLLGFTLNIVVLFGLILSVGMLVDGAIVVSEFADRQLALGKPRRQAYLAAAQRMFWPITASTATTLAAFAPLLFWPGTPGEFMKFLPLTVLVTLTAALLMALIVIPTLGGLIGRHYRYGNRQDWSQLTLQQLRQVKGLTGYYLAALNRALAYPWAAIFVALSLLVLVVVSYIQLGKGVQFFPELEPDLLAVKVKARGELALAERDRYVRQVEQVVSNRQGIKSLYTTTLARPGNNQEEDLIGLLQMELTDWQQRPPAKHMIAQLEQQLAQIPGLVVEVSEQQQGPAQGADIELQVTATSRAPLLQAMADMRQLLETTSGLKDIRDTRPLPGVEWRVAVDRRQASRFATDVATVGATLRLVTNGLEIGQYRPADAKEEVDILVRYPLANRHLGQLNEVFISNGQQQIPISQLVTAGPVPKTSMVKRSQGQLRYWLRANVSPELSVADKINELQQAIGELTLPAGVSYEFRGNQERQQESADFLVNAFWIALFIMAIILVTQFNSFYQALLVLSAIVFSTAGVLLGLLVSQQPFGIVMSGVGVIALAGVVVNNNIVLIDTFNVLRRQGLPVIEAALRTGAERFRPVLLTTITTVLGLLPMVYQLNVDLLARQVSIGAPAAKWWTQLATTITGGLLFATLLTLILTPCLLVLGSRKSKAVKQ